MPAIERTNFYKLVKRNAKVEHGDLGVENLKIKPSIRKRSDNANTESRCSGSKTWQRLRCLGI